MDLLLLLQPLYNLVPEVPKPKKKLPIRQKLLWTFLALLVYLVCSQIPLYGIISVGGMDPFSPMSSLLISSRATLMELGITAIVHSGMVMQLLSGERPRKKELLESAQKFCHVVMTISLAIYNVYGGTYGPVSELGAVNSVAIVVQLIFGGMIVILLDDMLQKGYGIMSGVSLFVAANSCEKIIWEALSPVRLMNGEYQGSVIQLFAALGSRNKLHGLFRALFRRDGSNLMNALSTVLMFAVICYVQGFQIEIPIQSSSARGITTVYPIRLFYTNTVPIMLQSICVSQLFLFAQGVARRLPNSWLVRLLWHVDAGSNRLHGGLCYYLAPPSSLYHVVSDPIHTVLYIVFMLTSCAYASVSWMNASSGSPKEVAKELARKKMIIRGHRATSTVHELNRYIPTAALMGGICVGAITIVADLLDSIGSGTGILLAVSTIQQIAEVLAKESFV